MAINIAKAVEGSFYPFKEILTLSDEILSGRLAEYASPCEVEGTYVVEGDYVHVDAFVSLTIKFSCDRCLDDVVRDFKFHYQASFYLEGTEALEGYYPYFNDMVDLSSSVEEDVLLKLPTRVLCSENCKGICPVCGINLNEGSCNCSRDDATQTSTKSNPFDVLKDYKISTGGANNGSTKG